MARNRIKNIGVRYQVLLERYKSGEAVKLRKAIDSVDSATRSILSALSHDIGELSKRDLQRLLAELDETNSAIINGQLKELDQGLDAVAASASRFEVSSLNALSRKIEATVPKAGKAYADALAQPLSANGKLLEVFTDDWSKSEVGRINDLARKAWGEGWTTQQLIQGIRGTKALGYKDGVLAMSRRNAEAVARTSIQHVANAGRMSTWEENDDIVTGYKFVATLDQATTIICRSLDGKVFKLGEGPVPPVHINCRSTTVAELDESLGLAFLDEGATRSSADGYVPADMTYYDWLKTQSEDFQNAALGDTRATLFRDGGLSAEKFAELNLGRNFQPLTLEQMRELEPLAFKRAGLDK